MSSHHRGASLVEALVALAILCLGLLGVGPWQAEMTQGGDVAARRMQALQIAERELEGLRSRDPLDAATGAAQTSADDPRYRTQRRVVSDPTARSLAWIQESVTWGDGLGGMHTLAVSTATNRAPAELSAVLVAPRDAAAGTRVLGRAPTVPMTARNRGDGRSVLAPAPGAAISFVFDNGSGRIAARCTGVLATQCTSLDALSVSGWIRVSLATPPDAVHPDDAPLPLSMAIDLTQGRLVEPGCVIERRDGALAYHCVIETDGGTWSGRSDVVAQGYVVCRYAPSHPERYHHIDRPLMQQNFLVIRDGQSCPVVPSSPSLPDGILTVAHQP